MELYQDGRADMSLDVCYKVLEYSGLYRTCIDGSLDHQQRSILHEQEAERNRTRDARGITISMNGQYR